MNSEADLLTLGFMFGVVSLLMIGLAVPLIQQRVKPNRWYGFRTSQTIKNPDLWYPVNARFGWWMVWAGVAGVGFTLLPLVVDFSVDAYSILFTIVLTPPLLLGLIDAFLLMRRLSREQSENDKNY